MEKDVIKYKGILLSGALLLFALALQVQISADKLKKQITVDRSTPRVDSFFKQLSRQTGIGFSFNSKKISPAKLIPLKKGKYTIAECLEQIKRSAGIHYAVMGNHIILVDDPPQEKYRLKLPVKTPVPAVKKTSVSKPVTSKPVTTKPGATKPVVKSTVPSIPAAKIDSSKKAADTVAPKIIDSIRTDTPKTRTDTTKIIKASNKNSAAKSSTKATAPSAPIKERNDFDQSSYLLAGIALLRPDIYDMIGIGANLQYEHYFSPKFSWTGAVGYNYLKGEYKTKTDTSTFRRDTTIKVNFAQIPVLAGLRYYFADPVYVAFEAGWSFKASGDVASFLTLSPSVGVKIPVGNSAIDVNVKYLYNNSKATIPEKPRLQKGDFGFWSLRLAWAF